MEVLEFWILLVIWLNAHQLVERKHSLGARPPSLSFEEYQVWDTTHSLRAVRHVKINETNNQTDVLNKE